MAKNPYRPGVGTRPPYLAGRDPQIRRFARIVEDYPEKRRNLRLTGLRGVGKTVLLKEFERMTRLEGWVVVRRDLGPRLCVEADFALAMSDYLREAIDALSVKARVKHKIADAVTAVSQISVDVPDAGVQLTWSPTAGDRMERSILEDRLRVALTRVGEVARAQGRGVALLFDEAHTLYDQPRKRQFPLGALLSAIVAVQDEDDEPLPVMLVLCGLPPLTGNIHAARSNAERLFRAEELGNLPLETEAADGLSDAALALVRPAEEAGEIGFDRAVAERISRDVDGYPFFIQWFGEALWDAADVDGGTVIDESLYEAHRQVIQRSLDAEFFEPRYRDARQADQGTLRVGAQLGGERFSKSEIDAATKRSSGAIAQSLTRLIGDNLVFRDDHGVYAYTAPLFGDFLRRRHPQLEDDE